VHRPLAVLVVVLGSLAAGVGLSFGQGLSAEGIAPLFNSALPVVTLAALAALGGRDLWACVMLGAVAGPLAMVGYYAASTLRGFGASSSSVLLWVSAGVVFGCVMGAAVWAIRQPLGAEPALWIRGLAVGFWPGIALGEAAHGLVRIVDTTPTTYWWTQAVVGVVVLGILAVSRLTTWSARLLSIASVVAVAASVFVAYGLR
jgi:hypothetical protein